MFIYLNNLVDSIKDILRDIYNKICDGELIIKDRIAIRKGKEIEYKYVYKINQKLLEMHQLYYKYQ